MVTVRRRNGNGAHNGTGGPVLQARMKSLRGDLGALERDLRGLVNDVGDSASEQVQGAMTGAMQSARDAAGRMETWGSEKMPRMRKLVRSQPFAACALALGAGAFLGAMLFRR